MRLSSQAARGGATRNCGGSARVPRGPFQRDCHDFGTYFARAKEDFRPGTEAYPGGHHSAAHEQTDKMSRGFFGADSHDSLEHVIATRAGTRRIRPVECVSVAYIQTARRNVEQSNADSGGTLCRQTIAHGVPRLIFLSTGCSSRPCRCRSARGFGCACLLSPPSCLRWRQALS